MPYCWVVCIASGMCAFTENTMSVLIQDDNEDRQTILNQDAAFHVHPFFSNKNLLLHFIHEYFFPGLFERTLGRPCSDLRLETGLGDKRNFGPRFLGL